MSDERKWTQDGDYWRKGVLTIYDGGDMYALKCNGVTIDTVRTTVFTLDECMTALESWAREVAADMEVQL